MRPDLPNASPARRVAAVFIDFFVFLVGWWATGLTPVDRPLLYALGLLFIVDVLLTAMYGASLGRIATGIRVVRSDGTPPGLIAALIRAVIVFLSGWAGLVVFIPLAQYREGPPTMWWDAAARTRVASARGAPVDDPVDPRTSVMHGFRLRDEDLVANAQGMLSPRQRLRTEMRGVAYGLGVLACGLVTIAVALSVVTDGPSFKSIAATLFCLVITVGAFVYAWEIWHDALARTVLAIDGVPHKEIEEAGTASGGTWQFPYLALHGEHKLGWRAFKSIRPGMRYRLYVLPSSGRCVGAVPLDGS